MNQHLKEWIAFLSLAAIWGSSFFFIKIALQELSPVLLVTIRLGLGSMGLWVLVWLGRLSIPTGRNLILSMMLIGVFNPAIPFLLITWGETRIDSGITSLLNSISPLFVLVFAHFMLPDEPFTWKRALGLLVGFSGVAVIFSRSFDDHTFTAVNWYTVQGQGAVVMAAVIFAATITFIRRQFRLIEPVVLAAFQISGAFLSMLILALAAGRVPTFPLTGKTIFALLWLSLLGTSLGYSLRFYILRAWGATRSALLTYLIPVSGLTLGVIFLDERLDWKVFAGGGLIFCGMILVNRQKK